MSMDTTLMNASSSSIFIDGFSVGINDFLVRDCAEKCYFNDGYLLDGICPQPMKSSTAFIFMALIEIIIRSQCDITDACRRLKTPTESDLYKVENTAYDFIIVGGGVAGTVIASRLSENPEYKVLLLEAGPEQPTATAVPVYAFKANDTEHDWRYRTVPQKKACQSNGGICLWPRGKMLGGTACLSGLMYTRGHPSIWNSWGKVNEGWNYTEVMKYFKKSENNTEPPDYVEKEYHGYDGPLKVGRFPYKPDLADLLLESAANLHYRIADVNGHDQNAFTIAPVMVHDGLMAHPHKQYLRPHLERSNLEVLINSHVTKIVFDNTGKKAIGVEFNDKNRIAHRALASKEVILSAGVVGSAQLLLLSGVGPKKEMETLKIPLVKDSPVGNNLHYHVGLTVTVKLQGKNNDSTTIATLHEFIEKHSGPFASTGLTQVTGFVSSRYSSDRVPDIQIYIDGYSGKCRHFRDSNETSDVNFRPIYLRSKCRGTIKLSSSSPYDHPLIDPNYLCDEDKDELILLEAVEIIRNLTSTEPIKSVVRKFDVDANEKCKHLKSPSNETDYWLCVIKEYTNGENHHAGTCKMGPSTDPEAVVDNELRIHGITNLRVADASIFPTPINCNTIGPTVMIGEKASDMIKKTWSEKTASAKAA